MEYKMKCYSGNEPRIKVSQKFIETNRLSINVQAAKDIMYRETSFFLDFECEVAIDFLPFKEGRYFFNKDYIRKVESGEVKHKYISDVKEGVQDFLDYMVFAWMKVMDERGLSAMRSIIKLSTWMEILNRKDIADILSDEKLYNPFGRPALKKACDELGIKYPDYL